MNKILKAEVVDTNGRARGVMQITAGFGLDRSGRELEVEMIQHDGKFFFRTGKTGTNNASGIAVVEMRAALDNIDDRLWASVDATRIWED